MGYVDPIETWAIIPPTLSPNVKFDITSVMIQLLNFKQVFVVSDKDETNINLANFVRICTFYTILRFD